MATLDLETYATGMAIPVVLDVRCVRTCWNQLLQQGVPLSRHNWMHQGFPIRSQPFLFSIRCSEKVGPGSKKSPHWLCHFANGHIISYTSRWRTCFWELLLNEHWRTHLQGYRGPSFYHKRCLTFLPPQSSPFFMFLFVCLFVCLFICLFVCFFYDRFWQTARA